MLNKLTKEIVDIEMEKYRGEMLAEILEAEVETVKVGTKQEAPVNQTEKI